MTEDELKDALNESLQALDAVLNAHGIAFLYVLSAMNLNSLNGRTSVGTNIEPSSKPHRKLYAEAQRILDKAKP